MATWSQVTLEPFEKRLQELQDHLSKHPDDRSACAKLAEVKAEIDRQVVERARDLEGL